MPLDLSADKGLLFRITHVNNLPWLLANGLPCANSALRAPGFVQIGNPDLIAKRPSRPVPQPPHGTLADYVPFYLTPKSPMLLNIRTGWNGIPQRPNADIAILVATVAAMQASGVRLLFTDRHAFMATARWSADPADLATMIDWDILRRHDFARSSDYAEKTERYQAEALAHLHVPVSALIGIGCSAAPERAKIEATVAAAGLTLPVRARPDWYF
jgi:hypothetical protein